MKTHLLKLKTGILCCVLALITLGLGLQTTATAQPNTKAEQQVRFESTAEGSGEITITGTSSLHDWEVVGKHIRGTLALAPGASVNTLSDLKSARQLEARVEVPVRSLESGKGVMNKKMFKALEAEKYESVLFVLDSLKVIEPISANSPQSVEIKGKLSIAGVTQAVVIPAQATWSPAQQSLVVAGKLDLRMTDYGIDPPRALLGTLKTGDEVTVSFRWTPQLKKDNAPR